MRVLFFIGSLGPGGKERRLVELLSHLKSQSNDYELMLLLNNDYMGYQRFQQLNIPFKILRKKPNYKDPKLFYQFYKICTCFKPDIIHTWGSMQTFYSLPTAVAKKILIVNSQITNAPPKIRKFAFSNIINRINFFFSSITLSNSWAGIYAYNPPVRKSQVIYNGINLDRFVDLPPKDAIRIKYGINTAYTVIMVANFSKNKNYDLFLRIANYICQVRNDISFVGAGGPVRDGTEYQRIKKTANGNPNLIFPGSIDDVEALVNACDIGLLLTNKELHGEGISNTVLEYMALGKPVIANDAGGTKELVRHNENGYIVTNESIEEISGKILELIDNPVKRKLFGDRGKQIVDESFTLGKMGNAFEGVYKGLLYH